MEQRAIQVLQEPLVPLVLRGRADLRGRLEQELRERLGPADLLDHRVLLVRVLQGQQVHQDRLGRQVPQGRVLQDLADLAVQQVHQEDQQEQQAPAVPVDLRVVRVHLVLQGLEVRVLQVPQDQVVLQGLVQQELREQADQAVLQGQNTLGKVLGQ